MRAYLPSVRQLSRLAFYTVLVAVLLVLKYIQKGSIDLLFLGWRIFLAWIPIMALILLCRKGRGKFSLVINGFLWVIWALFYLNAPYLLTTVIHIPQSWAIWTTAGTNLDLLSWYKIVIILLSMWIGILLMFYELYPIHQRIATKIGRFLGTLFVLFWSMLSSYGIYLGLFSKANGWDVLRQPFIFYNTIIASFNLNTGAFVLLFGFLSYIIYSSLYRLERH